MKLKKLGTLITKIQTEFRVATIRVQMKQRAG